MSVRIPLTGIRMRAVVKIIVCGFNAHKMLTEIRDQGLKPDTIGYQMLETLVRMVTRPRLCPEVPWLKLNTGMSP